MIPDIPQPRDRAFRLAVTACALVAVGILFSIPSFVELYRIPAGTAPRPGGPCYFLASFAVSFHSLDPSPCAACLAVPAFARLPVLPSWPPLFLLHTPDDFTNIRPLFCGNPLTNARDGCTGPSSGFP